MALLDKLRRKAPETGPPAVPKGSRVYAVGDVHGRADLLTELHRAIAADAAGYAGHKRIVYLGDLIDRGMESRRVIETLLDEPLPGFEAVYLMGNHEYALISFLDDPETIAGWLSWGGREMLYSYGIECGLSPSPKELHNLAGELKMTMPREHLAFIENTELCHRAGDYYFVHAGIRPGVPLEDQHFEDQLWIRDEFIESEEDHGAVIVHGHTITPEPELHGNRIGLDTGAFHSGILTCLVVEGTRQRLLQTDDS